MKSRDALSRLKRFEVEEKRRKVVEIESMIGDFSQMAADLDRQIAIEQERAGVTDINHYAYPTFAKAAVRGGTICLLRRSTCKPSSSRARDARRGGRGAEADRASGGARCGAHEAGSGARPWA